MSRLFLLRHAKAGWAEPGMRDFDRPLEPLGRTDADAVGAAMRAGAYIPDLVLCSTAKRARETLDWVARHTGDARVIFSDSLYSTDAAGYVEFIRAAPDGDQVLVVGHNPMMEDLADGAVGRRRPQGQKRAGRRFPGFGAGRHPLRRRSFADRARQRLSRGIRHARRSLTSGQFATILPAAATNPYIGEPRSDTAIRWGPTLGVSHHLHRRGADRVGHAERARGEPGRAVAAARRHRPVAGRQDGVHLGLRPQSDPRRQAAAVRGPEIRPHRPRLPGAAARRRGAALPVRGPYRGAGEGAHLAGFDARHLGASPDHRI